MRIYNAKRAQIEMPLSNGTKLVIPGNSISGEFMPNSTVISVFMASYTPAEVAFVISGPYEISMLSNFAGSGAYVVSSVEEAVARFAPKEDPTTTATPIVVEEEKVTPAPEPVEVTEVPVIVEEKKEEEAPKKEEEAKEVAEQPKKKPVAPAPKKAKTEDTEKK